MFVHMLYGIRDAHKSGIKEEDFSEVTKATEMPPPAQNAHNLHDTLYVLLSVYI